MKLNCNQSQERTKKNTTCCMFRFQMKAEVFERNDASMFWENLHWDYASPSWEEFINLSWNESKQNKRLLAKKINKDDTKDAYRLLQQSYANGTLFSIDFRYQFSEEEIRRYRVKSQPRYDAEWVIFDGLILDINKGKNENCGLKHYCNAKVHQLEQYFMLRKVS